MLTTLICTNCCKPIIIKLISVTADSEYLGVDPCSCKGARSEQPKKETNVTSLTLYREKRLLKEPKK